jgi:hypothetical protein
MKPVDFYWRVVSPTMKLLSELPGVKMPVSDKATVLVMTIAGQESRWEHRRQIGIGSYHPQKVGARGYWQFESTWGGPVALNDVMQKTPTQLAAVCAHLDVPVDELTLYEALAWNDTLACALARLMLWQDPHPLPEIGNKVAAWDYYIRNWRPGAPHPQTWGDYYDTAVAITGTDTRQRVLDLGGG